MPATYPAYPEVEDVESQLAAIEVTLPAGFDVEPYLYAAIKEWEDGTRYWPFLAAEEAEFKYSPPGANDKGELRGGARKLLLDRGFIAISEVLWGETILTVDEDYRLLPTNAPYDSRPYTAIELMWTKRGKPDSITITGEPGYCAELPAQVWLAIRDLAAGRALEALKEGILANPTDYKEGDIAEKFDSGLAKSLGATFIKFAQRLMAMYRRLT